MKYMYNILLFLLFCFVYAGSKSTTKPSNKKNTKKPSAIASTSNVSTPTTATTETNANTNTPAAAVAILGSIISDSPVETNFASPHTPKGPPDISGDKWTVNNNTAQLQNKNPLEASTAATEKAGTLATPIDITSSHQTTPSNISNESNPHPSVVSALSHQWTVEIKRSDGKSLSSKSSKSPQ